jgi:vacuolar fusion protein MON1
MGKGARLRPTWPLSHGYPTLHPTSIRGVQTNFGGKEDVGVPGVTHFIYKSRVQVQFTMPAFPSEDRQTRRLLSLYRHLHAVVHGRKTHIKIFHYMSRRFSALVWAGTGFECYTVVEGRASRGVLARGARSIVRWVRSEESRLFVSGGVVF